MSRPTTPTMAWNGFVEKVEKKIKRKFCVDIIQVKAKKEKYLLL